MKILENLIIYVSLSGWGRPDRGCRDKSDLVTDMVTDDFSNLVCPKNYSFIDGHSPDGKLTVEVTWEWFPCYKTGRFRERMSCEESKNIAYICRFVYMHPHIRVI